MTMDEVKVLIQESERRILKAVDDKIARSEERLLLSLPPTCTSLITELKAQSDIRSKFYRDNPQFKGREDVVRHVVNQIDGENPLLSYKEKIEKSVPEIRRRIAQMDGLNMSVGQKPGIELDALPPIGFDNGEI